MRQQWLWRIYPFLGPSSRTLHLFTTTSRLIRNFTLEKSLDIFKPDILATGQNIPAKFELNWTAL